MRQAFRAWGQACLLSAGALTLAAGFSPVCLAADDELIDELIFSPPQQVSVTNGGKADALVMDASGEAIAWVSDHQAGIPNIYLAKVIDDFSGNISISTPIAITPGQSPDDISAHPRISNDASQLIFQSKGDFRGRNPGKVVQTYRADISALPTIVEQLTDNQSPSLTLPLPDPTGHLSHAVSNGFGGYVVFSSSRTDFTPCQNCQPSADPSNEEVFLFDATTSTYYQVTFTGPGVHNVHPVIDDSGVRLAYISNYPASTNGDGSYEVFLVSIGVRETFESICDDGIDNDADGLTDCGSGNPNNVDPDCAEFCKEPPPEICDNFDPDNNPIDDDGDGVANCADTDCEGDLACPLDNHSPSLALTDAAGAPIAGALAVDEGQQVVVKIAASDDDTVFGENGQGDFEDIKDKVNIRITSDTKLFAELRPRPTLRVVSGCDATQGDACSCTLDSSAGCTLTGPVDATLSWKPDFTQGGQNYAFTVTVDDVNSAGGAEWEGSSPAVSQSVTIDVRNQNQAVKISPASMKLTMKQGSTKTIEVVATDGDENPIDFPGSGLNLPSWITSEIREQSGKTRKIVLTAAPAAGDVGMHTIGVTASDGETTAAFTGTIEVILNRDPVLNIPTKLTVNEGVALSIAVKASDPDLDPALSWGIDRDGSTPAEFAMPPGSVYLLSTRVFYWHPQLDYVESNGGTAGGSVDKKIRFWANDGTATVYKEVTITIKDTDPNNAVCSGTLCSGSISVPVGATTAVSLTFKNTGTTTWTAADGYALTRDASTSSAVVSAASIPLAAGESIPPGGQKTFTVNVQAPARAGTYYFRTRMTRKGTPIGTAGPTFTVLNVK